MSDITILTASLGRPSLAKLAEYVAAQTYKADWLVVFDGSESEKAGLQYLPIGTDYLTTHEGPPKGPSGEQVRIRALHEVTTKYVCFLDDDNAFHPDHVKLLMEALSAGNRFVSTRRVYANPEMEPIAKEDPLSELVDTNCSAIETQLLIESARFVEDNWKLKIPFYDRNLQGYLFARGIKPAMVNAYTVLYRVTRPDYINWYRGKVTYETIASSILVTGAWKKEDGAKPLSDLNYMYQAPNTEALVSDVVASVELIDCSTPTPPIKKQEEVDLPFDKTITNDESLTFSGQAAIIREHARGKKCLVEVGVCWGGTSKILREVMSAEGKLHLVDPFPADIPQTWKNEKLVPSLERAKKNVESVPNGEVIWHVKTSVEAAKEFTDKADFVFIDGLHDKASVMLDWTSWKDHIAPGGTLIFHDVWPGGEIEEVWNVVSQTSGWESLGVKQYIGIMRKKEVVKTPPRPIKDNKQTICLAMICKNEAHVIQECLDSVVNHIDYYIINDNGSTDGTQDLIRNYFKEKNIPGEIIDTPWKNFGFNRTEVFKAAEGKADYVLVIDADDVWQGAGPLPLLVADTYHVDMVDQGGAHTYKRKQLFKNGLGWTYRGVVHEYADSPNAKTIGALSGFSILSRRLGDRNKGGKKFEKDIAALVAGIAEEPNNARYHFYLAQSYRDNKQLDKAVEYYDKRISMGGWIEEVFYSMYQKAEILTRLPDAPDTLEKLITITLQGLEAHPTRAEIFYVLTRHCRLTGRHFLGHFFGKLGLTIPYPKNDILFIGAAVYDHALADETAVCCSWLNKPKDTLQLYEKALTGKLLSPVDRARIQGSIQRWKAYINK